MSDSPVSRLLVVSPSPLRGGCEEHSLQVATGALERGWNVCLAMPRSEGVATLRDDARLRGIAVADLPCSDDYANGVGASADRKLRDAWTVLQLLRRFAPDVVHINIPWPAYAFSTMVATATFNLPTLVVFHSVAEPVPLAANPRVYHFMRGRRQQWVAISDHNRRLLAAALKTSVNSISVIPNGIDLKTHNLNRKSARRSVRAEFGLGDRSRLLLTVARLVEDKGHLTLLAAAAPILRADPNLSLVIVGEGPLRERLEAEARRQGVARQVVLTGFRRDVPRLFAAADVFAFPSRSEALGLALIEAMATGLPIVTAARPGVEEVIRPGRDGLVTPVGNADKLRLALTQLLADSALSAQVAASARTRAQDFSLQRMLTRTFHSLDALRDQR